MDPEKRENRIVEIMNEMVSSIQDDGSLTLTEMAEPYRSSGEMGPCLIAFSRLEAEGLIVKQPDGKWRIFEGNRSSNR